MGNAPVQSVPKNAFLRKIPRNARGNTRGKACTFSTHSIAKAQEFFIFRFPSDAETVLQPEDPHNRRGRGSSG